MDGRPSSSRPWGASRNGSVQGPGRPRQGPDRVRGPARQGWSGSRVAAESRKPPRLLDGHRIRPASRIFPCWGRADSTTWEYRELLGPCTTRIDRADHRPGENFESTEQDEQGQVDGHFGLEIGRPDLPAQALLKAREADSTTFGADPIPKIVDHHKTIRYNETAILAEVATFRDAIPVRLDLTYLYSRAETLPGGLSEPPDVVRSDPIWSSCFHGGISLIMVQIREWILSRSPQTPRYENWRASPMTRALRQSNRLLSPADPRPRRRTREPNPVLCLVRWPW